MQSSSSVLEPGADTPGKQFTVDVKRLKIELGEQAHTTAASPFAHMTSINPALVAQYCELLNSLQMHVQMHESRLLDI